MEPKIIVLSLFIFFFLATSASDTQNTPKKKSWRDKDIRDMTEADLEHLLDQWEENDEPLEPDELPEHLRPSPKIDLSKIDTTNPDNLLRVTKKGKGVMMFVDMRQDISEEQADVVMRIWQTSLQNNHIIAERYPIDTRRSIYMFRDGSQAVDAKNYLLEQPELSHLTLEGQTYYRDSQQQFFFRLQLMNW
ncbi:LDLR chaperone boca isoform X2 [Harpegnathos saltator]|uniref:LDLR chaperone boca isoform X2 n=1 Tax=Harpegnathos saltator TaxID=610380 RepID=UPI000590FF39|nr:LDLR chaperone boca isoform X2 [Harpegnathos saltator]